MSMYISTYMYMYVYVYMRVCIQIYVYMYVYIYICVAFCGVILVLAGKGMVSSSLRLRQLGQTLQDSQLL